MDKRIDFDALPCALGAILLGIITLLVRDFALTWQPVPADWPARAPMAMVSGAILIAGGLCAPWRGAGRGRMILPAFYALWVLALHIPNFARTPNVGSLLGVAEILSLAAAGIALSPSLLSQLLVRISARALYGLCPLVFGLSHFVFADFTAAMMPSWIPAKLFWAYFTGAAHVAAGLAILTGVLARIAVPLLALMTGSFVLLLHVPRVAAAPGDRLEWTMLAMAMSIAGGAWLARRLLDPAAAHEAVRVLSGAEPIEV
jgi:uncharacterized membrane protein